MRDDIKTINIFIDGPPYKSIKQLSWENLPGFSVLTGLNGSGKTQLMEVLAYCASGKQVAGRYKMNCNLRVEDEDFEVGDIAFVPSGQAYGSGVAVAMQQLEQERNALFNLLNQHNPNLDIDSQNRRARVSKLVGYVPGMTKEQFEEKLPEDYLFMLDDVNVASRLAHVFYAHFVRMLELLYKVGTPHAVRSQLGPPPWEVLDDILKAANFPYRVLVPESVTRQYAFTLIDIVTQEPRYPIDLSSGERVILETVLWLFNVNHNNRLPKLLILDEPDAHLHPSMTRQFLDVIYEVIVKKHKIRVIMTTHSPSTVALAPEHCLFEMTRGGVHVAKSPSKAHTLGLLSSGLVIVSPSTRYILVEDEDDIDFYETLRSILSDYGPSRDLCCLKSSPSIVFLPASSGRKKDKTGGGCGVVKNWVRKFDDGHLKEIFYGVIDRDTSNTSTGRIFVGIRYAIENYFLDPLVVFCLLSQRGEAPKVAGVDFTPVDEHLIRTLDKKTLQDVVDLVCKKVQADNAGLTDISPITVKFTNAVELSYPAWMIEFRGHDLLPKFQKSFGGSGVIHIENLLQAYSLTESESLSLLWTGCW